MEKDTMTAIKVVSVLAVLSAFIFLTLMYLIVGSYFTSIQDYLSKINFLELSIWMLSTVIAFMIMAYEPVAEWLGK